MKKREMKSGGDKMSAHKSCLKPEKLGVMGGCCRKLLGWKGQQERKHERREAVSKEQKGLTEADFNPTGDIRVSNIWGVLRGRELR